MSAGRFDRPTDNPINWSFSVGRLFDIQIRLHLFFVLGAIFLISQDVSHAREAGLPTSTALAWGLGTTAALFLIVLLHEFGHCFGARYVGGSAHEIMLWPLGGLATVSPPHRAGAHLITAAAGPLVNVILFAILGVVLALWMGGLTAIPWNPFHPFTPLRLENFPTGLHRWLLVIFGINYVLFLFNVVLPVYPLDGGRILQAILWPRMGYRRSMEIATFVGMVGAIMLGVFAFFTEGTSFLLLGIAFFGYLTCYRQRQMLKYETFTESGEFGYDFSQGYTSLEEPTQPKCPGWLARRRARKLAQQAERERKQLQQREREFDRILAKISKDGMESLTPQERRLLEEETQRRRSLTGGLPDNKH